MTSMLIRRALLGLALATAAPAWGPYSHVIVNQLAVPRLTEVSELAFLKEREYAVLFARAGASADLAFSLRGGGKMDPAVNAVLHDPGFHAELYHRCREAEDRECQAFALGMAGHAAADRVGNAPESASAANSFGWPTEADVFGDAVGAPRDSAAAQLRTVTIGVNKILIDGLLKEHEVRWRDYSPFVAKDDLVGALQAYDGPGALPNDTPEERAAIAKTVKDFDRSFGVSYGVLRLLARRVYKNRRLGDPLEQVFGGEPAAIPAVRASVDAVVGAVTRLVVGAPGPVSTMASAATPVGPACHELGGATAGLLAAAQEHSFVEQDLGSLARPADEEGDEDPVSGPAPLLPDRGAGAGDPPANQALAELRKRVMTEVGKHLLVPRRSWSKLREEVRELVPIARPVPPAAPGYGDLFGPR